MAARINMTYSRPDTFKPTCGTSDPGIMQLMMLPGTAARDIMVHNVMQPLAALLRTRLNNVRSRRQREQLERGGGGGGGVTGGGGGSWSREQRRGWWRALGQLSSSQSSSRPRREAFTMPVDESHVAKSRKKRTVVGLYSYAPWLTNDVMNNDLQSYMARLPRLDVHNYFSQSI